MLLNEQRKFPEPLRLLFSLKAKTGNAYKRLWEFRSTNNKNDVTLDRRNVFSTNRPFQKPQKSSMKAYLKGTIYFRSTLPILQNQKPNRGLVQKHSVIGRQQTYSCWPISDTRHHALQFIVFIPSMVIKKALQEHLLSRTLFIGLVRYVNTTLLASVNESEAFQHIKFFPGLILFLLLRVKSVNGGNPIPSFHFLQYCTTEEKHVHNIC